MLSTILIVLLILLLIGHTVQVGAMDLVVCSARSLWSF
jgi:hypothetical protein